MSELSSLPTAVVLAGGRGTRLRPFTITIPKPLVPLGELPIIEIMIRRLSNFGFKRIILAINHMGDLIQAYCGDGSRWGVQLEYSFEGEPMGTIAPLRLIDNLPEYFLVVNADVLTDIDFRALLANHASSGSVITIATARRNHRIDYGVVYEAGGTLAGFEEKPVVQYLVSMGVYAASRRVLDFIPPTGPFGFDQLLLRFLAENERVTVHHHTGFWLDIGRPDDYELANEKFVGDLGGYI